MMPRTPQSPASRRLALAMLLCLALAPSARPATTPAAAAVAPRPPEAEAKSPTADVEKRLPELMAVVEEYRGLRFAHPVPLQTISPADLGRELAAGPGAAFGDLRTLAIGLKAFGLVPQDVDLEDAAVRLTPNQLAGFYQPRDKRLALVTGPGTLFGDALAERDGAALATQIRESLVLHELTHALEDQHFDLSRLIGGDTLSDAAMARLALAEGDATLVMLADDAGSKPDDIPVLADLLQNMIDHPQGFLARTRTADAAGAAPASPAGTAASAGSDAPRWFDETTAFTYLRGARFCIKVLERGGRRLLDQAFSTDPPRSSEQILHPEKWFDHRDDPVAIAWPALRAELPGYVEAAAGELGEMGIGILLRNDGEERSRAEADAAGWGGDRFAVYRRPATATGGAATFLAWITEWDTGEAAARFAAAARGLGGDWQVERTAPRRVVVVRGALPAAARTALVAKLAAAAAKPGADRAVDPAAFDPQRKIGAGGKAIAARSDARRQAFAPKRPLSTTVRSGDGLTYTFPEVGLAVRLPAAFAGWQRRATSNQRVLAYLNSPQGDSLTVIASDLGPGSISLELFEGLVEKSMASSAEGFTKLDGRVVETGGQPAYELHYSQVSGGVKLERLQRLILRGHQVFSVTVEAHADRWPAIEPSARMLLAGMTLAPLAPAPPASRASPARAGGTQLVLQVRLDPALATGARAGLLRGEVETLRQRFSEAIADSDPGVEALAGDRIQVQLPPLDHADRVRALLLAGGLFELRLVAYPDGGGAGVERAAILGHYGGKVPADVEILASAAKRPAAPDGAAHPFYAVFRRSAVTSRDFSEVRSESGQGGEPVVTVSFGPQAAARFGDFTLDNVGRAVAFVVDGKVILAPVIRSKITDRALIEGGFTPEEAEDLAIALRHPLAAAIRCLESRELLQADKLGPPHPCP